MQSVPGNGNSGKRNSGKDNHRILIIISPLPVFRCPGKTAADLDGLHLVEVGPSPRRGKGSRSIPSPRRKIFWKHYFEVKRMRWRQKKNRLAKSKSTIRTREHKSWVTKSRIQQYIWRGTERRKEIRGPTLVVGPLFDVADSLLIFEPLSIISSFHSLLENDVVVIFIFRRIWIGKEGKEEEGTKGDEGEQANEEDPTLVQFLWFRGNVRMKGPSH